MDSTDSAISAISTTLGLAVKSTQVTSANFTYLLTYLVNTAL